jgi:hypothetical protein
VPERVGQVVPQQVLQLVDEGKEHRGQEGRRYPDQRAEGTRWM